MNYLNQLNISQDLANVLFIGGPTASGKTSLSIRIAKDLQQKNQQVSIISADSRQIYSQMTVCTAKPVERSQSPTKTSYLDPINYQGIDHYLFDIVEPDQRYTLFNFQEQTKEIIQMLHKKSHKVLIVGGTGLYIDSLINNYSIKSSESKSLNSEHQNQNNQEAENYKQKLLKQHQSLTKSHGLSHANQQLWDQLERSLPKEAAQINKNNWQGVIRALEVYHVTGAAKSSLSSKSKPDFQYQMLVLNPPRPDLYNHINKRCEEMISEGLIEETKSLLKKYNPDLPSMTSIGYRQIQQLLNSEISQDKAIEDFQQATRKYAKRQLTWFRRYKANPYAQFIDSYKLLK